MLTADKSRELRSRGLSSRLRVVADTDNVYWVESLSHPNEWHRVTPRSCDCPGYEDRGYCTHHVYIAAIVRGIIQPA